MTPRPTHPLRRILYLRRRPLAALCAFTAVLAALLALNPAQPPRVTVVTARSALPAGTLLAAEHLSSTEVPLSVAPDAALEAEGDALGHTLSGPVTAGSVLTSASVSTGGRLARPGHVVAALPVPGDGIAALVRPGARLDVLDANGEALAQDIPVVAPPDTPGSPGLPSAGGGRTVLVEVRAEVAAKLASQGSSSITVVVR